MATFTISVPEELKKKLEQHSELNWAEYLRRKFEMKLEELELLEKSNRRRVK